MKKLLFALLSVVGAGVAIATADDAAKKTASGGKCPDGCCELITSYEKISAALAADDLKTAQSAAKDFTCWAECMDNKALTEQIAKVEKAASIDDARAAFKTVSATVIPLAEKTGAGPYFVMTCPMAKADWIQTDKTLANPYYGASMLRCGTVKKEVKPAQS